MGKKRNSIEASQGLNKNKKKKTSGEESLPRGGKEKNEVEVVIDQTPTEIPKLFGKNSITQGEVKKNKKKRLKKVADVTSNEKENDSEAELVVEAPKRVSPLNFKNMSIGMSILGAVKEVNEMEIIVSLPNNMWGYVSITEISDELNDLINSENSNQDSDEDETSNVPDITSYFPLGSFVQCVIVGLDGKGGNHKIELSLKPSLLHRDLSFKQISSGMLMSGSVKSVEDHGYIISFGKEDFSGFLPREKVPKFSTELEIGQIVFVKVEKINKTHKVLSLDADPSRISQAISKSSELTMESLLPGLLIDRATIEKILPNGLFVSFFGFFNATIEELHYPSNQDLSKLKIGKKIKARILYNDPENKVLGLSALEHIVEWKPYEFEQKCKLGIACTATISQIKNYGAHLSIQLTDNNLPGFVHISRLSDEHITNPQEVISLNQEYNCRILSYSYLDGLIYVTMKKSDLEKEILLFENLECGMLIEGKIKKITDNYILIEIGENIVGKCSQLHFADVSIGQPQSKYKINQKVKCRVLKIEEKKVSLTMKKTLINSNLPIIKSFEDVKEGMLVHGYIGKVGKFGCIIHFYGDTHGLVPVSELGTFSTNDHEKYFKVGQVVKCRVISIDLEKHKLKLSFIIHENNEYLMNKFKELQPGDIVSGTVKSGTSKHQLVILTNYGVSGVLEKQHLSDHDALWEKLYNYHLGRKSQFSELLVLSKDEKKCTLFLSIKQLLLESAKQGQMPKDSTFLEKGKVVPGYISKIRDSGCLVKFLDNCTGWAYKTQMHVSNYVVGQTVRALVVDTDPDKGHPHLSLNHEKCWSMNTVLLNTYFAVEKLVPQKKKNPMGATSDRNMCSS